MEAIILEDGIKYVVVDKINYNLNTYIYLAQLDDEEKFCVRKLIIENNQEILVGLESSEELKTALKLFANKNQTN